MRPALALLLLLAPPHPAAKPQTILAAIRAGQWAEADSRAAAAADPLARKLVLYYRLLTPGAARATEIATFLTENPAWPNQSTLAYRLQDALLSEPDDPIVADICRQHPPTLPAPLLRCAEALSRPAPLQAEQFARLAWIVGPADPKDETPFLSRWPTLLTPEDQWRRFDHLAWTGVATPGGVLARQALRLSPAQRPAAEAWLALKRDDPTAPALLTNLLAVLPEPTLSTPALILELARWYRRAGQDQDAATIWTGPGLQAEATAPPEHRAAFWDERNLLARRLLRANDPAQAYAVTALQAANPESAIDQSFLAGWIALRRLSQPTTALKHFTTLATLSHAAITQARAHYWLARAQERDNPEAAKAEYAQAAAWPTTYYGQLAARALHESPAARLSTLKSPIPTEDQTETYLAQDLARAAILLTAWGEPRRARPFLTRLDERAPTNRSLIANLALALGLPDQAVATARRAGRDGLMLVPEGWPTPITPPATTTDPALTLALIRQESSFDIEAQSPVGARGLMQLMPATATATARRLNLPPDIPALTSSPAYNMRLGTAYLETLLSQFNQTLPFAIAAYNAGPARVQDWLIGNGAAPGDPRSTALDMIDWIEMIPFNETRNYVQRVIENTIIYRAQRNIAAPHPTEPRPG